MSIDKTCSVPGEQSPLHAKAAFFWPCLGGHTQLTQLHRSELNTVSEGQEEVRTWSCKSIKQAMARELEDMKNKLPIQSQSEGLQPRSAQLQNALLQGTALLGACAQHSASSTLEELLPFIYSFLSPILSGHIFNPDPLNGLQTNSNIEESMLVVFKNVSPLKNAAEGEKLLCW